MNEEYKTKFEAWYAVPRVDPRGSVHVEGPNNRTMVDFGGGVLTLDLDSHDLINLLQEVTPVLQWGASIVAPVKGELMRFDGVRAVSGAGRNGEPTLKLESIDRLDYRCRTTEGGCSSVGGGTLGYWLHIREIKNAPS